MDCNMLIDYNCRCGTEHRTRIHWIGGITAFKCSNVVENKTILKFGTEVLCSECGCEIWHNDINNNSEWCQDCINGDSEKYLDK